jgi:hypothetical protein
MNVKWTFLALNAAIIALMIFFLASTLSTLFRGRPSWGQARAFGMTATLFFWTQTLFYLAVADAVTNLFGFVFDWPLWAVLIPSAVLLVAVLVIYRRLKNRETFRPALFVATVLLPLGMG